MAAECAAFAAPGGKKRAWSRGAFSIVNNGRCALRLRSRRHELRNESSPAPEDSADAPRQIRPPPPPGAGGEQDAAAATASSCL